jgi:hypothetical protein
MGRTETIRERAVWLYLPTVEQKQKWKYLAKKKYKTSLSRWIVKTVEDSLEEVEGEVTSREDIVRENDDLRKEVARLQEDLRVESDRREYFEREIRRYRAEPFLDMSFQGFRRFDRELVDILRKAEGTETPHRFVSSDEILQRLGIQAKEEEAIKAVSNQLTILEVYGLVVSGSKGWRWRE